MTLWALFKQNCRHIIRTKLLLLVLIFSFLIQYLGLKGLHLATVRFQGVVSTIDGPNALFLALYFQLFTGAFLAAAYGIWMVPYLHQGHRGQLTHVLPVPKWVFALSYCLSMLALLLVQHAVLFLAYGVSYGFGAFSAAEFPWHGLWMCLGLQTLAFEVFMMALAVIAMSLGQIPTFFLGALSIFVLQLAAGVFRLDIQQYLREPSTLYQVAKAVYLRLPPMGELVFDMREQFLKPSWDKSHWVLWVAWLALFVLVFWFKIRRPGRAPAAES